jgi:hypothetical protein
MACSRLSSVFRLQIHRGFPKIPQWTFTLMGQWLLNEIGKWEPYMSQRHEHDKDIHWLWLSSVAWAVLLTNTVDWRITHSVNQNLMHDALHKFNWTSCIITEPSVYNMYNSAIFCWRHTQDGSTSHICFETSMFYWKTCLNVPSMFFEVDGSKMVKWQCMISRRFSLGCISVRFVIHFNEYLLGSFLISSLISASDKSRLRLRECVAGI